MNVGKTCYPISSWTRQTSSYRGISFLFTASAVITNDQAILTDSVTSQTQMTSRKNSKPSSIRQYSN